MYLLPIEPPSYFPPSPMSLGCHRALGLSSLCLLATFAFPFYHSLPSVSVGSLDSANCILKIFEKKKKKKTRKLLKAKLEICHTLATIYIAMARMVKNLPAMQAGFNLCAGKIPWRWEQLPTPLFWPGEFYGLYRTRVRKESDTTEQFSLIHNVFGIISDLEMTKYMGGCA